jgi:hypothetical protein
MTIKGEIGAIILYAKVVALVGVVRIDVTGCVTTLRAVVPPGERIYLALKNKEPA